ncbi:hypothetical protein BX616_002832, partial [Lobosporangium transversale]
NSDEEELHWVHVPQRIADVLLKYRTFPKISSADTKAYNCVLLKYFIPMATIGMTVLATVSSQADKKLVEARHFDV